MLHQPNPVLHQLMYFHQDIHDVHHILHHHHHHTWVMVVQRLLYGYKLAVDCQAFVDRLIAVVVVEEKDWMLDKLKIIFRIMIVQ
jgi:hypothetical protein